mmetsp:Transcript_39737/g.114672  ORF Transcript_39737/g.114672 Transcript_39737/m.114672 type:complete len:106 (-) Transcript_39737:302-619(-)
MAAALVSDLHGQLLRAISRAADHHFQGLSQASRMRCDNQYVFDSGCRRKLQEIDHAFHVNEHNTEPSCRDFLLGVLGALAKIPQGGAYTPTPDKENQKPELFDIF